jgi:acyl transferase domain-containing protein
MFAGQGTLDAAIFKTGSLAGHLNAVRRALGGADRIDQFVLAAAIAHDRALRSNGLQPAALVGHGFGELAALVCGGAFTLEQAAEIAARRAVVLDAHGCEPGGMLTLQATTATAEHLVRLAGAFRAAVAAENGCADTVVSGTNRGLKAVRRLARAKRIPFSELSARWPLHCGELMRPAAMKLAAQLRPIRPRPLEIPVFSPTLRRYYRGSDDLTECLAWNLARRVRFADAVRSLAAAGLTRFVDCGALRGLARHVHAIVAAATGDDRAAISRSHRVPDVGSRQPVAASTDYGLWASVPSSADRA